MSYNKQVAHYRGKTKTMQPHREPARADFGLEEGVDTPVTKLIGAEHNASISGMLKGTRSQFSAENLKKILSVMTQRKAPQYVGTSVCVALLILHLIATVILIGVYYENGSNTFGTSPLAWTAYVPVGLMAGVFGLAAVSFWSTEPDIVVITGIGSFATYVCFFVAAILVLRIATPVNWSSCPSMDPPGTAIYKQMFLYGNNTFAFYPLDFLNPDSIPNPAVNPRYYTIDDWKTVVGFTVKEVICKNNMLYQFFWWLNMAMFFIGGLVLGGLLIDAYNRRKEAEQAWSYMQRKLPFFNGADEKQYVEINAEPQMIQQMPMESNEAASVNLYPEVQGGNENYYK